MNLPTKKRPGHPILANDWNALIDAVAARTPQRGNSLELVHSSGGFYYRSKGSAAPAESRNGRFTVTYNPAKQRLHVGEGAVLVAKSEQDHQSIKPHIPTLDSKSLSENPYWELGDIATGVVYNVWCLIDQYSAGSTMLLLKDSESIHFEFSEENAVCVACLTFKTAEEGGGLAVDGKIYQEWCSDIPWFNAGTGSSDDSSDESSEDVSGESSDGANDDSEDQSSGGDSDESSEDSSDDSSDESSSSSCGCALPELSGLSVTLVEVDGSVDVSCLMEDETNGVTLRSVTVEIGVHCGPVCDECAMGWVNVQFSIGGRYFTQNAGSGDFDMSQRITFHAFPCTEYTAKVRAYADSSGSLIDRCCLNGAGPFSTAAIQMPGTCSNLGACE